MSAGVRSLVPAALSLVVGMYTAACDPGASSTTSGGAGGAGGTGGAGGGDLAPEPTAEEWAALQALRWTGEPPPPDATNTFADSPAAAAFGQRLFFDPRFSGRLLDGDNDGSPATLGEKGETGKVSCAGCHVPEDGFSDTRSPGQQISLAAGWILRRTPSLLDSGHRRLLHWDGRRDTSYNQALGVVEATLEYNSSRYFFAQQLFALHRAEYEALFGPMPPLDDPSVFPPLAAEETGCSALDGEPSDCQGRPGDMGYFDSLSPEDKDAVTRVAVNAGKAIGAYVRRLSCGPGRLDAWLAGDETALTPAEKRGALTFVGKGKCVSCHSGPLLTDHAFHNVGLLAGTVAVVFIDKDDPGARKGLLAALADPLSSKGPYSDGDDGRLPEVVTDEMLGAFATPGLRCVAGRPAFMHTGQMKDLAEVVDFFDRGGHPAGFLGESELGELGLGDAEKADLVAFLRTLDGPGPAPDLLVPPP